MPASWEYRVVEEPNSGALQERLAPLGRDGWEAVSVECASDGRLIALVRRVISVAKPEGSTVKMTEARGVPSLHQQ